MRGRDEQQWPDDDHDPAGTPGCRHLPSELIEIKATVDGSG